MTVRPDYSPMMLRAFLHARAGYAVGGQRGPAKRACALKTFKARMRRLCRLTWTEFDLAWTGRLLDGEKRARIWAVLGHHPCDHGIVLTHGGQTP